MNTLLKRFFLFGLAIFASCWPLSAQAEPAKVALVPLDWGTGQAVQKAKPKEAPRGSYDNPYKLMDLIRKPELMTPDVHVMVPKGKGEELLALPPSKKTKFSASKKWKFTKELMGAAGWEVPGKLLAKDINVKSIRVTGTASTYGRNDGFAGQLTSSGKIVNASTAALQMDLAHVLADMGVVPFSMRNVRATLTMPSGARVHKNLEDKGGLVNYLGEGYWRRAIANMDVNENGVGTLAPLPASHYRVVDIFTQSRSTLIPGVTVEIHLHRPIVRKRAMSAGECQTWMAKNYKEPKS